MLHADLAISTTRALFAATPLLLLGGYLIFAATYCYRKGEVGGLKTPGIVKRSESAARFFGVVVCLGLQGLAFVTLGVYWFMKAVR